MGQPPLFPAPDPREADDSKTRESRGSEFLPVDPFHIEQVRAETLTESDRKQFLRRVRWLLATGIISFAIVSWMLARSTGRGIYGARASDPIAVVRVELGSLANGDLESAYAQFSERYRKEVSFDNYHALVSSHRRMFLTRQYRVTRRDEYKGQTFVEAQLTSSSGQHFTARFTLIEAAGRWWIDDLHWDAEPGRNSHHA
jgi:hypothetical protein